MPFLALRAEEVIGIKARLRTSGPNEGVLSEVSEVPEISDRLIGVVLERGEKKEDGEVDRSDHLVSLEFVNPGGCPR